MCLAPEFLEGVLREAQPFLLQGELSLAIS